MDNGLVLGGGGHVLIAGNVLILVVVDNGLVLLVGVGFTKDDDGS